MMSRLCGSCGANEGGLHVIGCDLEECPVCLGQLTGCGCSKFIFGSSISDEELEALWCAYLEALGRIAFLPKLSTKIWEGEGESPRQELMTLILESLQQTPKVLPNPKLQEYPPVELKGFGSFKVRYCAPRPGRDTATGEPVIMRERLVPIFTADESLRERFTNAQAGHPSQINSSSSLIRSLDCAIDFLCRTKERQVELQGVGTLRAVRSTPYNSNSTELRYYISITFFADFMDNFEKAGLLERRLPAS